MSREARRFSDEEKQRIRAQRKTMTLRRLAERYSCSTSKILCALGLWRYPRRGSYKRVSQ